MTLTEFLTARLDEDEATARRLVPGRVEPRHGSWSRDSALLMHLPVEERKYIARHDPARVLAEVDAKRRIVAWCSEREQIYVGGLGSNPDAARPEDFVPGDFRRREDSVVLRLLALPYADHPDYRQEWKP